MGRVTFFGGASQAAIRIGDNVNLLDTELISIGDLAPSGGGKTFEWDSGGGVTAPNTAVTIGASATLSAINLRDAINANKPTPAVTAFIDPQDPATVRIEADDRGLRGNMALVETMSDPQNEITGALLVGGEDAVNQVLGRDAYLVTAIDVLAGSIVISTGLPSTIRFPMIEVRTVTGLKKILTSLITVSGNRILIDFDGATNPVAGDTIGWIAWE